MTDQEFSSEFEKARPSLVRFASQMAGRSEDAEDVAQDAMLLAWRGRTFFRGTASVKTWLKRIVRNCVISLYRYRAIRPDVVRPCSVDEFADSIRDGLTPDPEQVAIWKQDESRVDRLIGKLPLGEQGALFFYRAGRVLTNPERSAKSRAILKLRKSLAA